MTALDETERDEVEREFRDELQAQHDQRIDRVRRHKDRAREKRDSKSQREHDAAVAAVKNKVREDFYKEQGYKLYEDSTGREIWLPPEEYDWRMKRRSGRRKRKKARYELKNTTRGRTILFYAGMVLVSIVVGVLLTR